MSRTEHYLHNIIKIQYSNMGYLPNLPYHLISDIEMFNAFLSGELTYGRVGTHYDGSGNVVEVIGVTDIKNPQGYFVDNYPFLWDDENLESVYHRLLVEIASIIDNYTFDLKLRTSIGDINFDGKLDDLDINLLRHFLNNIVDFTPEQKIRADAVTDGKITAKDLLYLRRLVAAQNYPELYPINEIPDWLYSYMLGMVVGPYSAVQDRHNLLVLLDTDNIDDEFTLISAQKCYETSELWLKKIASSRKNYPTIFGEPHVIKALRLNKLSR